MKIFSSVKIICFTLLAFASTAIFANTGDSMGQKISDSVITSKIKSKMMMDPSILSFNVDVSTNDDGVVTLVGEVKSDTNAAAVIQIAQSTKGVTDVDASKLTVKESKQPFADMVITAKVKGIFIRENLLGQADVPGPATNVVIETNHGVVYLSGKVNTQKEADDAINLAKTIKGVKKVESRLKIG